MNYGEKKKEKKKNCDTDEMQMAYYTNEVMDLKLM